MLLNADPSPSLLPLCLFQGKIQQKNTRNNVQKRPQNEAATDTLLGGTPKGERKSERAGEERRRARRGSVQEREREKEERGERPPQRVTPMVGRRGGRGGESLKRSHDGDVLMDGRELTPKEGENLAPTSPFLLPATTPSSAGRFQKQFRYQIATEKLFRICKSWSSTAVFSRARFFRFFWSEKEVSRVCVCVCGSM